MNSFNVGDLVLFGRPNGEQTRGKIVKVNRKTYKVQTLESRGRRYAGGTVWSVAKSLCRPDNGSASGKVEVTAVPVIPHLPVVPKFRVYDRVKFDGLVGTVKRVNRKTLTVQCDNGQGYYVPHSMAQLA